VFQRNFEAYSQGRFASWTAWTAPDTMSAGRGGAPVGMSEADLRSVNTIPPRMLIKAGSVLIVPRSTPSQKDVTSHVADNGQLSLAPEVVTRRTTVKARKGESVATVASHASKTQAPSRSSTSKVAKRSNAKAKAKVIVKTKKR
jgi:membrane-bound lytic murein transglycosylase D